MTVWCVWVRVYLCVCVCVPSNISPTPSCSPQLLSVTPQITRRPLRPTIRGIKIDQSRVAVEQDPVRPQSRAAAAAPRRACAALGPGAWGGHDGRGRDGSVLDSVGRSAPSARFYMPIRELGVGAVTYLGCRGPKYGKLAYLDPVDP
ncbi:hypothetical protein B0I37DRAFT_32118 [Chaetomium sp. MPI-CAGE-AT-0009]|nr:hypothetical protein B0I37DRAFT_32118 [Chaetomium sp. MPI-CAGE-AT-0009]